ncbi:Ssl1-like-domain-containing protein [Hysterangium stoloniferum]|nr:Ssl1-like-domain-containing protein [Hysterangium stoloniferum]
MARRRDDDYMDVDSDSGGSFIVDDPDFETGGTRAAKTRGKKAARRKEKGKGKAKEQPYSWEASYTRSWDVVQEDEGGSLQHAVEDLMAQGRRRRLLAPTAAIRRTIIRHLIILLDLSASMMDRDMRPTRFDLTLEYSREFVVEWFDQNPLGQIGIVGMRGGVGERIGEMAGNPQDVLKTLEKRTRLEPSGEPSLQNAIDMAIASMSHLPTHSSREIVIIYGSLTTVDPGNIHDTLDACVRDKVRVSVVALAAEMKICRTFCEKTGGTFGVALNEGHFKDLLFELIPPPAQRASSGKGTGSAAADLMIMGFPTRLPDSSPRALCVCHSELKSEGFICPRCMARLCDVPTDCDICGLMIVSSPHLARSYHHLFPVKAYTPIMELSADEKERRLKTCHACSVPFKVQQQLTASAAPISGLSPLDRYRCPECQNDFCAECDLFVHEVVHVCPGCG